MKTVVERTEILFEADGSCGLLIVRLDDIRETFMDSLEAEWALTYTTRDEVFGGSLYAILGHDNVPILCDFETWNEWQPLNILKGPEKFECSPEIEATVFFSGRCTPELCMDGRPKFWAVNFFDRKKNEHYGYPPSVFETLDEARAFVDKYISWGCPPPGTPHNNSNSKT